jgi:hypothetical protein
MKRFQLVVSFAFAVVSFCTAQNAENGSRQATVPSRPVELRASKITPLAAVLRMGIELKIPLGLIMGSRPVLCGEKHSLAIKSVNFKDALTQALTGTGYKVALENDVYVLEPPDPTTHETKLLNFRFERFSTTNSTMVEAGALLAGYIATVAEGAKGFALDTLSSTSAEAVDVEMRNVTTREIANHIVTQKSNGVWVFYPTPDALPTSNSYTPIEIYSYRDDAKQLENLRCEADSIRGK